MTWDRNPALWHEAAASMELAALRVAPVFWGFGVPRGDGRLVLVLPGSFGNDLYLTPMRDWLARIGYRPVRSTLALNAGCSNRLVGQIEAELRRWMGQRPGPVAIVGHSRGGGFAWALASRLQDRVSHVALLGSPAAALVELARRGAMPEAMSLSNVSLLAEAGRRATRMLDPDCTYPDCNCEYIEDLRRPLSPDTRVLSIYSRDDTIVRPSISPVPGARNVEVSGSHGGLVYNRAVYPELAAFLATTTAAPAAH